MDDFHTYHVGRLGVWVHNMDCCDVVNPKKRIPTQTPYHPAGTVINSGTATRVNIVDGPTNFTPLRPTSGKPVSSGFKHVLDGHFNRNIDYNRSVFTIQPNELKQILSNPKIVNVPVTAMGGGQYTRVVNTGTIVGKTTLKEGGLPTTYIQIITDHKGNLITTYPVKGTK